MHMIAIRAVGMILVAIGPMRMGCLGLKIARFFPHGNRPKRDHDQNANAAPEDGPMELLDEKAEAIVEVHFDRREAKKPTYKDGEQLFHKVITERFAVMMVSMSHSDTRGLVRG
jgi:hypothetical protein